MGFYIDRNYLEDGESIVSPFDADSVEPASVDLTLGSTRYSYSNEQIVLGEELDTKTEKNFKRFNLKKGKAAYIGPWIQVTSATVGLIPINT